MIETEPVEKTTEEKKGGTNVPGALELEAAMKAQIERNNEWIEKMSPVVKYKIQEYIRKQKAKKQQRRKFSLACGLMNRVKAVTNPNPPTSTPRRRAKRVTSEAVPKSVPKTELPASVGVSRRKSAPAQKMDMRDLDDLE